MGSGTEAGAYAGNDDGVPLAAFATTLTFATSIEVELLSDRATLSSSEWMTVWSKGIATMRCVESTRAPEPLISIISVVMRDRDRRAR